MISASDTRHSATGERTRDRIVPAASALGLRLLVLATIAGSGALSRDGSSSRLLLAVGIIGSAALGFTQYAAGRRLPRLPGEPFVLGQVAIWGWLMHLTGGQHSPLLIGLLLEVPLAAGMVSRRGAIVAALSGAVTFLGMAAWIDPPFEASRAALALGFLAVTAILSTLLMEILVRQQRQIETSKAALSVRAENLAEELRLLGDYLNGALLGLDDLGRVVSVNRAAEDLLGVPREVMLGRAWQETLRLDREGTRSFLHTISEGVAQRGLRLAIERTDGRRVGVEVELWVSPSGQGRRTWVLLDAGIHERGEGDPLRRLGEAVACVSHQIKNSLHALQGFTQEIQHEIGNGTGKETTGHFVRALKSLDQLADDVLAMSGAPRPAGETVNVGDVLSTAVMLARVPGVRVEIESDCEMRVQAHRGQLVHALFNLIDNACRVTPAGTAVRIRAVQEDDRVVLEIIDSGPGLPEGIATLEGRAPSRTGSGFGLLAARRFLEANQGQLSFESRREGGTLSRIALHAAPAVIQEA